MGITINKAYWLQENEHEYLNTFSYQVTDSSSQASRNVLPLQNNMVKIYNSEQWLIVSQSQTTADVFTTDLVYRSYIAPQYHVVDKYFVYNQKKGWADVTIHTEKNLIDGVYKMTILVQSDCDNGESYTDSQTFNVPNDVTHIGFYIKTLEITSQFDTGGTYGHLFQTQSPFNLLINEVVALYQRGTSTFWHNTGVSLSGHDILIENGAFGKNVNTKSVQQSIERSVIT